jgi:hypothetical protein
MGMSEIRNDLHSAGQNVTSARQWTTNPAEPVRALANMRWAVNDLESAIAGTVALLRADGVSWQVIADQLGITRQGAQQRFGNVA